MDERIDCAPALGARDRQSSRSSDRGAHARGPRRERACGCDRPVWPRRARRDEWHGARRDAPRGLPLRARPERPATASFGAASDAIGGASGGLRGRARLAPGGRGERARRGRHDAHACGGRACERRRSERDHRARGGGDGSERARGCGRCAARGGGHGTRAAAADLRTAPSGIAASSIVDFDLVLLELFVLGGARRAERLAAGLDRDRGARPLASPPARALRPERRQGIATRSMLGSSSRIVHDEYSGSSNGPIVSSVGSQSRTQSGDPTTTTARIAAPSVVSASERTL